MKARVQGIITLLVEGRYADLESQTSGIRLNKEQIAYAVSSYGRRLVPPPDEAFELMEVAAVRDVTPPRWSIIMPLWTLEEGRSDLTLELTFVENGQTTTVELDDIHVL